MPEYTVYFENTVSTSIAVKAGDPVLAIELAYDSPDMPGTIVHGAFGSGSVDESGEWLPVSVSYNGEEVWKQS